MKSVEIKKILVPVDFSDVSREALHTAAAIAGRQQAELTIMNVLEFLQYPSYEYSALMASRTIEEMRQAADENLKKFADEVTQNFSIHPKIAAVSGGVTNSIVDAAANNDTSLIVIGTHGASGLRKFFIGSNAYSVIKKAPCPVLTVPHIQKKEQFRQVLFPVRLATPAIDKYEVVREIVRKNNATLHVLCIVSGKESSNDALQLQHHLEELYAGLNQDGTLYTSQTVQTDNPADETLQLAKKLNADLIVATANLDHTFREFFIGPYVQQIVNHASVPVLSVRPPLSPDTLSNIKKKEHLTTEVYNAPGFAV